MADGAPAAEPEASVEASVTMVFDASVEAAREAAPPIDSPVDAVQDVAQAPVVVTVVGALGLEAGVTIVWGDASGAVVTTGTTDVTGSAMEAVPGGMVTALLGTPAYPAPYTITGIQPGDNLVIVDWGSMALLPGGQESSMYSNNVKFTSIPASPPTGTTELSFVAGGTCSTSSQLPFNPPATVNLVGAGYNGLEPTCLGIGHFGTSYGAGYPAMVEADDSLDNLLGFAFTKNNALTVVDDAGSLDVAVGGPWSTAITAQTLNVTNVPTSQSPWIYYSEVAEGVTFPLPQRSPPDAGLPAGETLYATHVGYADFVQTEVGSYESPGFVAMATRGPAPTVDATSAMDWSALNTLPSVTHTNVDRTVLAQPMIHWTTAAGTLGASTAVIAYMSWYGSDPDGGSQTGSWTIVSQGTTLAALQAPAVPAASSAFTPIAGSTFGFATVSAIQGATALPSYAQVRAASSLFAPLTQTTCVGYFGPAIPPLPVAGTVMVSVYGGGCG